MRGFAKDGGRRHWWSLGGAMIGVLALAVVLWRLDFANNRIHKWRPGR